MTEEQFLQLYSLTRKKVTPGQLYEIVLEIEKD